MKHGGTATVHHVLLALILCCISLVWMDSLAESNLPTCAPGCQINEQELVCRGQNTSIYLTTIISCVREMSNVEAVVIEVSEVDCGCKWYDFSTKVIGAGIQLVVSNPVRECLQLVTTRCRLSAGRGTESPISAEYTAVPRVELSDKDFVMNDKGNWETIKRTSSKNTQTKLITSITTTTPLGITKDPQEEEDELARINMEKEDVIYLILAVTVIVAPLALAIATICCTRTSQTGTMKKFGLEAEIREMEKRDGSTFDRLVHTWKKGEEYPKYGKTEDSSSLPPTDLHDVLQAGMGDVEDSSLGPGSLGMAVTSAGNVVPITVISSTDGRDTQNNNLMAEHPSVSVQTDEQLSDDDDADENTGLLWNVASVQTDEEDYPRDEEDDNTCSTYLGKTDP